jgi:uncharacterized membrane protein HdeD (DUF308 family)
MSASTLMWLGVALSIFGLVLLISPVAVGNAVVRLVAIVLLITGIAQLVHAFRARGSVNIVVSALLGAIVAGVGVMVWFNPNIGSGFLTALLIIFFVVNGMWKVATALRYRRASGWGWLMISGLVSLLFVYLLWKQWPLAGAWAIGVLVGIDLLLTGVSMILLSRTVRRIPSSGYVETINL